MRGRLRWAAVGTYVVALVVVAFWPTPVTVLIVVRRNKVTTPA
jgi:hypothetical protein